NNILHNAHSWHGVITIWDTSALSVSDYNVVMDRFGYPDDATVIGLAAWQALGYDEHSIIATPAQLFVDTATPDYHLKTGSPAIAAGTVLAEVTDDRDGTPRPAGGPYDLGCYQTEGTPADPTADFSASPTSGVKPLSVTFSDLTTGVPTSWQWSFGDGATSDLRNPTHQYQQAGSYTVSLSVANGLGDDVETKTDFIKAATFPDVLPDNWAWEQVEGCVANDVVQGYGDGTYQPLGQVARDQMAVYAARAIAGGDAGVPDAGCSSPPFTDVLCDHWARKYIQYAVAQGVVQGYPEGDYKPDLAVTRDQMAVYVARAMVAPTGEAALDDYVPADPRNFPDVPNSGYGDSGTDPFWAYTHIEYCVENGVVQGYLDGYYYPNVVVTRDQMAVYVARAFGLLD
ncbi:MAG: S-layer homology domain-containing protein, partial [Armatimonadota bacterium]|nr:S-layer homology domain-containing protein [Armatimonadota bacterium]